MLKNEITFIPMIFLLLICLTSSAGTVVAQDNFSLAVQPSFQSGTLGEKLTYTFSVVNLTDTGFDINLSIGVIDGTYWDWSLSTSEIYVPANTVRSGSIYVIVGSGEYSTARLTAQKSENDDHTADVTGFNVEPVTPPPVFFEEQYFHALLAIIFSMMFLAIGSGIGKGKDPTAGILMFFVGLMVFWIIGWLPSWLLIMAVAVFAMLAATKWSKLIRGGD